MRLIDADALIADIEEYQKSMVFHSHGERMHFDDMIDFAVDHIEEAPTIDAVPVVPAVWIEYWIGDAFKPVYRCSNCDRLAVIEKTNYCPKCGARMDGDPHDSGQ